MKISEIHKVRNTKILPSDQDWDEEISMQKMDIHYLRSGNLNLKQISLISQRAFERLKVVNDGYKYIYEYLVIFANQDF